MSQRKSRWSSLLTIGVSVTLILGISVAYAGQGAREEQGREIVAASGAPASAKKTGEEAPRPPVSTKAHEMTVAEYEILVKQGHSPADVTKAAELARRYGSDVKAMLKQRAEGVAWETIEKAAVEQYQAELTDRQKNPGKYKPDKVVLQTQAGLTPEEVDELLSRGLEPAAIVRADGLAALLGLDLRAVLHDMRKEQTADDAIREALRKSTPEERKARRAKTGVPDALAENAVRSILGEQTAVIAAAQPLTETEMADLVARGHDRTEIQEMSTVAKALGLDPREVVAAKRNNQTWAEAVREVYNSKGRRPEAKNGGN